MRPIANWRGPQILNFSALDNVPLSTKARYTPSLHLSYSPPIIFSVHIYPRDMTVYVHQEMFISKTGPNAKKFTNKKVNN